MAVSKAQIRATAKWEQKNLDLIRIKPHLTLGIRERIAQAVSDGKANSMQDYIIRAVLDRLADDGYTQD